MNNKLKLISAQIKNTYPQLKLKTLALHHGTLLHVTAGKLSSARACLAGHVR